MKNFSTLVVVPENSVAALTVSQATFCKNILTVLLEALETQAQTGDIPADFLDEVFLPQMLKMYQTLYASMVTPDEIEPTDREPISHDGFAEIKHQLSPIIGIARIRVANTEDLAQEKVAGWVTRLSIARDIFAQ